MVEPTPRLRLVTDAASEPVTLADAKAFCRVDITDDDTLITSLITSARKRVEKDTGLALLTQTWVCVYDRWPDQAQNGMSGPWWDGVREGPISMLNSSGVVRIPKRPFQSVTQIQIRDAYSSLTTVDPTLYFVEASDYMGRIIRKLGAVWPIVVMPPSSAIEITFKCGFDATPYTGIPDDLIQAVKFLIKNWYDQRDMIVDGRATPVPHSYDDLIASWRSMRLR